MIQNAEQLEDNADLDIEIFNPLDFPSIFIKPRRLVFPLGWVEHIPFAFFLIEVLKPRILVELGTHSGNSYCAMCQSVQQHHLDTKCYAVDTWHGDEHSRFYGPQILENLRSHHDLLYGGFSRLIQSTFDEAAQQFPRQSIDLLHIDGCHTYDHVLHDFETWLPKVSPNGIILFHDTNVRESDFGVWQLWSELSPRYPHFEFFHGHGLGVLAMSDIQPRALSTLLKASGAHAAVIRRFFAECGRSLRLEAHLQLADHHAVSEIERAGIRLCEAQPLHAGGNDSPLGYAQIFVPTRHGYTQENSTRIPVLTADWTKLVLSFDSGGAADPNIPLRLDPIDGPGTIEIAGVEVLSETHHHTYLRLAGESELESITVSGSATRILGRSNLTLFSFANDPQVYLPVFPVPEDSGLLRLQIWMRYTPDLSYASTLFDDLQARLTDYRSELKAAREQLQQREDELSSLRRALEDTQAALLKAESLAQKAESLEQIVESLEQKTESLAQKAEETDTLRDLLHERESTLRNLRRAFTEQERQVMDLYNSLSWRMTAPLRRFAWIRDTSFYKLLSRAILNIIVRPFSKMKPSSDIRVIRNSGLFDEQFYVSHYRDIAQAGIDPLWHYVHHGALERRDPNPFFHTGYYLRQCPDVAASRKNPLRHFIEVGASQRLNPNPVFNTAKYVEEHPEVLKSGINPLLHFIQHRPETSPYVPYAYDQWMRIHALNDTTLAEYRRHTEDFKYKPLISIIMPVYNIDRVYLEKAIDSVLRQVYPNWELCIVDDASPQSYIKEVLSHYSEIDKRIKIAFLETNHGMVFAYNTALSMASGEFVGTLDHDDELTCDALYENIKLLNSNPHLDLIYSDEDKIDLQNRHSEPFFKPDFSPDLLLSFNYICHFTLFRHAILDDIGGFRSGFDGSQDYDLILRVIEKTRSIAHIPKILYHWRRMPESAATAPGTKPYADLSSKRALDEYLERNGIEGKTEDGQFTGSFRVKRTLTQPEMVSIIIPFRDKAALLKTCISSILQKTQYPNYEILLVNNSSTESETIDYLDSLSTMSNIRVIDYNKEFNYSAINNYAAEQANGYYLLLLNNDIEVISEEWLSAMVEHGQRREVGAVGAKLLFPNHTIQHAGVVMGLGTAGHAFKHLPVENPGYFGFASVIRNYCAVTGACLLTRKAVYDELGGLNAKQLPVAFNDVDMCLRAIQAGYLVVYTPYALLYHHESASRGYDDDQTLKIHDPEKYRRIMDEERYMQERWKTYIKDDPFYSPNLTRVREDFEIRLWDELDSF